MVQTFNRGVKEGNKADSRQAEHDMKQTRDARDELRFQQIASFFSNLTKSQRKAGVEAGRPIPECLESDDEEPIYQYGNLKALQLLVEN